MRRLMLFVAGVAVLLAGALAVGSASGASGSRIVFPSDRADGVRELYVVDAGGTGVRRLTFNDVSETRPLWSPDRSRIAFTGTVGGERRAYVMNADGTGQRRISVGPGYDSVGSWTADGRALVVQRGTSGPFGCPCGLWLVRADGTGEERIETGPGNAILPDAAPTGRRIVFSGDRRGVWELYTADLSGSGVRRVTDAIGLAGGDVYPRWAPNGVDIAFARDATGSDNDVYTVRSNGADLRRLTDTPGVTESYLSWSPAGDRVIVGSTTGGRLVTVPATGGASSEIPTALTAPLADPFSGSERDASIWHQAVAGSGTTVGLAGGALDISIDASAVAGGPYNVIEGHWGLQCSISGDYDVEVGYRLLDWPAANGVQAALSAFFVNANAVRESQQWGEQYFSWLGGPLGSATTTDRAGALRLVRSGATVTSYYRLGSVWVPIASGPAVDGPAVFGLGASTDDTRFAHRHVEVAFDDVRVTSGSFSCPDWWNAGAADWR